MKIIKEITLFFLLFTTLKITAQIGVGVDLPKAQLHIVKEGKQPTMIVEDLEEKIIDLKHKNVFVDEKGEVFVANSSNLTSYVSNFKATKELALKASTDIQIIPFSDETTPQINNATRFVPAKEAFEIIEDGIYEVSGYVGFNPQLNYRREDPTASVVVVLGAQVMRKGTSSYSTFVSPRYILSGLALGVRSTISFNPTLIELKAGDLLRMVIQTPVTFGSYTVNDEDSKYFNIVTVGGAPFSRAILIKKM